MNSTPLVPTGRGRGVPLVDPANGKPVLLGAKVIAHAAPEYGLDLGRKLALSQVEARTGVCRDVADVSEQLVSAAEQFEDGRAVFAVATKGATAHTRRRLPRS